MNVLWKITGGRPMIREGRAFVDSVNGRPVDYFIDRLGVRWLAHGPWALFRVQRAPQPAQEKKS